MAPLHTPIVEGNFSLSVSMCCVSHRWFVKRVPRDFDWPTGRLWHGYVNPWPGPVACPECLSFGFNAETRRLYDTFRSWAPRMTLGEERILLEKGVTKNEVARLRRRRPGSDTPIVRFQLVEIRAQRKGVWGPCEACQGEQFVVNPNPAVQQLYESVNLFEEWQPVEPPDGDGWQLWEKPAPEGYPVSPVFSTAHELGVWCAETFTSPFEEWLEWIEKTGSVRPESKPPLQLQSDHFKVFVPPAKKTRPS